MVKVGAGHPLELGFYMLQAIGHLMKSFLWKQKKNKD